MSILDVSSMSYIFAGALEAQSSNPPAAMASAQGSSKKQRRQDSSSGRGADQDGGDNDVDEAAQGKKSKDRQLMKKKAPPLLERLYYATSATAFQTYMAPIEWYRGWQDYMSPPEHRPDIIKAYEVRQNLPVRIFFPKSHSPTSPDPLPLLMTIHGGGFVIGSSPDDDKWNRCFADMHYPPMLVVSLNYSKSPRHPFPTALQELRDLVHAVVSDESLPIDRAKTALLGFSAGGNLALSVAQLPTVGKQMQVTLPDGSTKSYPPLSAAVSVYGALDLSLTAQQKVRTRFFKPSLPGKRGATTDFLADAIPVFDWSYVPYGHSLVDPSLSPAHAPRAALPAHVCVVGAELDMLAHEAWRTACRLANEQVVAAGGGGRRADRLRQVPGRGTRAGRQAPMRDPANRGDVLELADDRFAWEEVTVPDGERASGDGGRRQEGIRSVKWLLLPDMLHGSDYHMPRPLMGDPDLVADADIKTEAYMREVGRWLIRRAWGGLSD